VVAVSVVTLHLGVRAVLTGSMRPDYGPGAILLTERVPTASVRPGMIVLFVPPGEHVEYAHRITSVTGPKDAPVITTKGDANKVGDPWHAQLAAPTVNRVVGSVPAIGRVLVFLRGSGQILLAVTGGLLAAWGIARWTFRPQPSPGRRTTAGTG
jgi:signal peptidase I